MIIYKDIITGDELFTDAYKLKYVDDFFIEIDGKMVSEKDSIDESKIGANPSSEETEEACTEVEKKGVDVVLQNRLNETFFGKKKEYMIYLKGYLKRVREILQKEDEDKAKKFEDTAQKVVAPLTKNFDNFNFYLGASGDPDGHIALMDYRDDQTTPYLIFFKDGLIAEKV